MEQPQCKQVLPLSVVLGCAVVGGSDGEVVVMLLSPSILLLIVLSMIAEDVAVFVVSKVTDSVVW